MLMFCLSLRACCHRTICVPRDIAHIPAAGPKGVNQLLEDIDWPHGPTDLLCALGDDGSFFVVQHQSSSQTLSARSTQMPQKWCSPGAFLGKGTSKV